MFKILVIEDQEDFYQDYLLRHFEEILPMEKISTTHVPTIQSALAALVEPWNVILMDYSMGAKVLFENATFRDGVDLITFRRAVEAQKGLEPSFILGTSSNSVGNYLMKEKGADDFVAKNYVTGMAESIKGVLDQHECA